MIFDEPHEIPLEKVASFFGAVYAATLPHEEVMAKLAESVEQVDPSMGDESTEGPPVPVETGKSVLPGPEKPKIDKPELAQEAMAEEATKDRIIQALDQRVGQLTGAMQAAEQGAAQMQQQTAELQQQGAMAQEQLQQQLMQSQATQEQAQQESMAAREDAMAARDGAVRLRQAMQAYRENLANLAMQDPTPPDQQVQQPLPPGGPQQAVAEQQQAEQAQMQQQAAEQRAAQQGGGEQPQAAAAGGPSTAAPQKAAVGPGQQLPSQQNQPKPKTPSLQQGAMAKQGAMNPDTTARIIGALLGAGTFAGIQGMSAKKGKSGQSYSETKFGGKLDAHRGLMKDRAGGPSAVDKLREGVLQHQKHIARTSREHPQAAAVLAALAGAAGGALIAPSVRNAGKHLLNAVIKKGHVDPGELVLTVREMAQR